MLVQPSFLVAAAVELPLPSLAEEVAVFPLVVALEEAVVLLSAVLEAAEGGSILERLLLVAVLEEAEELLLGVPEAVAGG